MTLTEARGVDRARLAQIGEREEAAYRQRTRRSAALHERAQESLPLGVASSFQTYDPYPLFMTDARGSRITDVDGNEYVDLVMGFGALLFGHSPSFMVEAVQEQIARGLQLGAESHVTGKVAALVSELTGMERVGFCNSGSEAVMMAGPEGRSYGTESANPTTAARSAERTETKKVPAMLRERRSPVTAGRTRKSKTSITPANCIAKAITSPSVR